LPGYQPSAPKIICQIVKINGKNHSDTYVNHTDIFIDKAIMKFEMNKTQN
jgi:hypothetical protein